MDEKQAVVRLKQGDIGGLETLVGLFYVRAVRAAYLVTRDRPLAEDVAQAAFVKAYERIAQFDPSRPFAPWFLRIVVNDAAKSAARRERDLSLNYVPQGDVGSLSDLLPDPGAGPEELAEQSEVRQAVWDAMGRLSPTQREVVVLRYYLDMKEATVADRIGSPLGTVKRRLHHARLRLRALLGNKPGDKGHGLETEARHEKERE